MINQQLGNPLVRAAVRTVLTGGALAAAFGVANAQQAPAQQTNSPQANTQASAQASTQNGSQVLVAQATVPPPAPGAGTAGNSASLQLQEVVVTGSRIATPNQTSISPVQFVSAKEFSQLGATRVEDVLNRLPQVFADQNATSINGGTGIETVDLRGLGANRTLVLINGLRLPFGDPRGGGSDLNLIPTSLIQNVQILTGGASSIYGADAVAGVVNFKLLDNFQGVKLIANGSGYFHTNNNDQGVETTMANFNAAHANGPFTPAPGSAATGAQKMLTFIAGMNTPDNKGNATFYASYRNIAKATQNLYSYSACSMASGYAPPNGNGLFSCSGSGTSYPGTFYFFGKGTTYENTIGAGGAVLPISAEPKFNYGPLNYMQAPEQTWNAGAFLHYTFNDHAEVYASTMFMDNKTDLQIAYSGDFGTAANVNCANPYLSTAEVGLWCDGSTAGFVDQSFTGPTTFPDGFTYYTPDPKHPGQYLNTSRSILILRRDVEGSNRTDDVEHQDWRMVLGLKGAISENWTYDVSYQYSLVNLDDTYLNDMSTTRENDALDVVNGPNGPECAVTAAGDTSALAAGCVPWNIFTPGGVTQAAVNYLETPALQHGQIQMHIIDANFTGDLSHYVQLPTAHSGLQLALGTEYRDINSFDQPDVEFSTGDLSGQGGARNPVKGAIESFDEYIEARLPLIQDEPFAKSLLTDDSFRRSSYALGFKTNTFSLGLVWQPIDDVRLRGTFTRAVRAPNIIELYAPQSVALDGTVDPCSGPTPTYSAAQCANTGVSGAQYGKIAPNPAAQYNGFIGGNPDLKPETATTKSFGIQFTPSNFLPNFSASIDYYDIAIKNVINSIGENTILTDCAGQDLFCNLIHRDQYGSLWLTPGGYVTDTLANVGELEEKGIDVQLNYSRDLGRFGNLSASFTGTHISAFEVTPIAAMPASEYDCAGYYGSTCSAAPAGGPLFGWRHDLRVTWVTPIQALSVTAGWRYLSGTTVQTLSPNPNLGVPGATIANGKVSNTDESIPAYNYLDLSGAYQVTEGVSVRLGVNNLMDRSPPVIGSDNLPPPPFGNGNTIPGVYDWGGRYVFGEISAQF